MGLKSCIAKICHALYFMESHRVLANISNALRPLMCLTDSSKKCLNILVLAKLCENLQSWLVLSSESLN